MSGQLNTFIDRLFGFVPEAQRAEARPIYSSLQDAVKKVGEVATQQQQWWDANKDAVTERDQLRVRVGELEKRPATPAVDQNAIEEAIRRSQAETLDTGLGLITTATTISANHFKEFGEPLDMRKLATDAIAAGQNLEQYYQTLVAPRREERRQADLTAQLEAARKEGVELGRKEVLAATGGQMPFPSPSQSVSTLSGLRKPADGNQPGSLIDQAVAVALETAARQQ